MAQNLIEAQQHLSALNEYHLNLVKVFGQHVKKEDLSDDDRIEIATLDTKLLSASNSYNASFLKVIGKYVPEENLTDEDKAHIQAIKAKYESRSIKKE